MDEFLRNHSWVAWVGAVLAFIVFVILLLHMTKILFELRQRLPRGGRSRQLRLGFVENFDLDGERQLLLVRRDNVEHLLLIGGPNDILVESGIVRVETRSGQRAGFEAATQAVAPPHSPAPVLAPLPAAAAETPSLIGARPEPARSEPARSEPARPEPSRAESARFEPAQPEPARSEPRKIETRKTEAAIFAQQEIDVASLEEELRAAFEAAPFAPPPPQEQPPQEPPRAESPQGEQLHVESQDAPPIAPSPFAPPPAERPASRFTLPPRPSFKAPLPPSRPPAGPGDSAARPRFVIPPLARRTPVAPASGSGETPEAPGGGAKPPLFPPRDLFAKSPDPEAAPNRVFAPAAPEPLPPEPVQAEPSPPPPQLAPPQSVPSQPAPQPKLDQEHLESLEDEMAKLLGRPPHK